MKKITIINGPNLNLLGTREPGIYGNETMETFLEKLKKGFGGKAEIRYFQSNVEGEIINKMQEVAGNTDGIILNAGGYSHTSISIADCISAIKIPVIEVHISNILARESFRHTSMIGGKCKGMISGFGLDSYRLAVEAFMNYEF